MAGLNDLLSEGVSLNTPSLDDAVGGSSNKDLMAEARMTLSGNWGLAVVGYVLFFILIGSMGLFSQALVVFAGAMGSSVAASLALSAALFLMSGPLVVGF